MPYLAFDCLYEAGTRYGTCLSDLWTEEFSATQNEFLAVIMTSKEIELQDAILG